MLGYHCEYESGDIKVNTDELTDAQWFDIGNLPNIPPKISISGRLIASYLEGHLKPLVGGLLNHLLFCLF